MKDRTVARTLAERHLAAGDPLGWFESLYALAGGDASAIPWANLEPNPNLLAWLDARPQAPGGRALVVGCGLGDDAEELSRRGLAVTAFDVAPTAVAWCKGRFPDSPAEYVVADLLAPPPRWARTFDVVFEANTLQVLPADLRPRAMQSLAGFVTPAGELLVVCRAREPDQPAGQMPWPLTRPELTTLAEGAGLVAGAFEDFIDDEDPPVRRFRAVYRLG